MTRPLITLTTDFGGDSPYVAQMKAVILSIEREAVIVDITHAIPPQNVLAAAVVLQDSAPWFPSSTIHVAVVDPGVGTARRIVCAEIGTQRFIAPDNGLLSGVAGCQRPSAIHAVTVPQYWEPSVSATFHGRDILAPVAAHWSRGLSIASFGETVSELATLDIPAPLIGSRRITGQILAIDHFGNLITNIRRSDLAVACDPLAVQIAVAGHNIHGLSFTYGQHPPDTRIALFGSCDRLEIAVVNGNAKHELAAEVGDQVVVIW